MKRFGTHYTTLSLTVFGLPTICWAVVFGDGNHANGIEDQRVSPPARLLNAVGTIYCDGGLRGTATHIDLGAAAINKRALSIIVTAAHVLFDPKSGQPFQDCSYRPENKRLNSVPFAEISSHDYQPLGRDKIRQSETDIVFVSLQRPLYQKRLKLGIFEPTGKLQLLGYNSNKERISLSPNCKDFDSNTFVSEHLLLHNCDASRGSSGGPLLSGSPLDSVVEVVAVHGGTLLTKPKKPSRQAADGAPADPEKWINQARKIDQLLLARLQRFIAYLRKDSADQIPHRE
ncbi:MAG: hypothetical protein HN817_03910 [Porticoccaceae bacterium]|jgi:hypothetical protein|nr:hypothetical protein [Porticoccaceae bacterium]MBT5577833.1 hypothetical protein [Porticoccaceae bacterium]MBT7375056.1 hypothetical protein [Porticoccaceae bacterium]